ncbi:hypothetical protein OC834_004085 [Tilletia horrida]|nr:hypothetical protein OC834_004085 [Tilletia horrida]
MICAVFTFLGALLFAAACAISEHVPPGPLTTFWDCCKASASWPGAAPVISPAVSCARDGMTWLGNLNEQSACGGGPAYTCTSYQPFVRHGIGIRGHPGKVLITQVINEGPLQEGQFDLQVPGGGVGDYNACPAEYGSPPNGWGARFGGVNSRAECGQLPPSLRQGCYWKYDFFAPDMWTEGADRIKCPAELTRISHCIRRDD